MAARDFLSSCPLSSFEQPEKLHTVNWNDSSLHVLELLSQNNILCAPVHDGNEYTGVVDMARLVNGHLLDRLERTSSHAAHQEDLTGMGQLVALKSMDTKTLKECKQGYSDDVVIYKESDSLLDACKTLGTFNAHRILVGNDQGELTNFVTQSAVVRLLANNIDKFPETAAKTLVDAHLSIPSNIITCSRGTSAIEAFKTLRDKDVSAMPVVCDDGSIIGNLSVRDIRAAMSSKRAYKALHGTVTEYIAANAPDHERSEMFPAITCSALVTVGEVLSKLATSRIHRVYVVDPQNKPVRVITLSDVLALMVTPDAN